jgi:TP901 family phage tail tape measure protein
MSSSHRVSVEIGAALSSGWTSAFRRAPAQVSQLGDAIRTLESRSKRLDQFQTLKDKTDRARTAWKTAQRTVARLNQEIARTEEPTQTQIRALRQAEKTATRARTGWERNDTALRSLRQRMEAAGESTQSLTRQQTRLGRALDSLRSRYQALGETQRRIQANSARRDAFRGQMLDAVALGAALGAPIKAAIDFESAMADVKKVVSFSEPDGLIKMGDTIKAMSREIPITAAGLAQITAAGGQLGIKAIDLPDFTETVAKMSTAFDMLPEQAGDAMAKLANVYQMPIKDIASLGDAINHLSDNTAAKAQDIVPVLQRVGGTAKQFGLGAVQVAALADSFIALGKPPEVAATAINALLVKLQTASKQGKKFQSALSDIGLSGQELEDAIAGDAQGALMGFLETLEGVDEQSRAGILTDLFGMEYSDDISLLAGSLDNYRKALSLTADKTQYAGSMQREFEARSKTTENNLALLKNQIAEVGINLGSVLLPALNTTVGYLRNGSAAIADFSKEHPVLTKAIMLTAGGLIAAKVAAIGLGYGFTFVRGAALSTVSAYQRVAAGIALTKAGTTSFSSTFPNLVSGWQSVTAGATRYRTGLMSFSRTAIPTAISGIRALGIAAVTNPIGIAITALAVAGGLIYKYWQPLGTFFGGVWKGFSAAIGPVTEGLKPLLNILSPIGTVISWVGRGIGAAATWFGDLLTPVEVAGETLEEFASTGERVGQIIGAVFKAILSPIKVASKAIGWVGDQWNKLFGDQKNDNTPDVKKPNNSLKPVTAALAASLVAAPITAAATQEMPTTRNTSPAVATIKPVMTTSDVPTQSAAHRDIPTTRNAPPTPTAQALPPTYNITINAAPGQDSQDIARQVAAELERIRNQDQRGALHD